MNNELNKINITIEYKKDEKAKERLIDFLIDHYIERKILVKKGDGAQ